MQTMKVQIRTKAPVILSALGHNSVMTATQDFFSGSVLRGIFAARFIETQELGRAAHEDADFMRLFFGGLRFVDGYPVEPTSSARALRLPLSLQRSKDGSVMRDLLQKDAVLEVGFKNMKGFAAVCGRELYPVAVRKGISLHMSRSDLGDGTGKERLAGKSKAGGIYNYEAIAEGQLFEGLICGSTEELCRLRSRLGADRFTCCVGRSKYTQYGLCEITLLPAEELPALTAPADERICFRMETPFLPHRAILGNAASMIAEIITALNARVGGGISIAQGARSIFAKAEEIDNFVGVWGMRRPRETALAAGTVFAVEKQGGWRDSDMGALHALLYDGIGRRREEGFGQLRLWDGAGLQRGTAKTNAPAARELSIESRRIAEQILLAHIIEQIRVCAATDVEEACRTFPRSARHAFSRLESTLGVHAQGARDRMRQLWADAGNEQIPMRKMLRQVRVAGRALHEYLSDPVHDEMPYAASERKSLMADENLAAAAEEIGMRGGIAELLQREEIFYEYWHAFFRYARKAVVQTEKGGATA